jgi:2,3-bisphosphoglycerate-dependent phosphoglycerate mutase
MAKVHDPKVEKTLIPVFARSELNERMYGELQGLHKNDTLKKFGEEQYLLWRRSYHVHPPKGESLEMTAKRALPFFQNVILNDLKSKKNILISAHGNSLRAIVMFLDRLSEQEVIKLEIPTGEPLCYEFKSATSWTKEPASQANAAFRR